MGKYRINIKYNTEKDADVIQRLEAQENMQDYIRRLIRADIAADHLLGLQEDIEDGSYKDRVRFWEEHCLASVDPGIEDPCNECRYHAVHGCTLEMEWKETKGDGEI